MSGGLNALALTAIVDHVEVGLQDLLLRVLLFHVQGGKDLPHLSEDGVIILIRDIFNQLLRQGRAATAAAGEELADSVEGGAPVHAAVFAKAVVLNGHLGGFHIGGDVVQRSPHPVFVGVDGHILRGVPLFVIHINKAGIV